MLFGGRFMSYKSRISEHWTVKGKSVVVTGSEPVIASLVSQLELPMDSTVHISSSRAAVALWGQPLETYIRRHRADIATSDHMPSLVEQADVLIASGTEWPANTIHPDASVTS